MVTKKSFILIASIILFFAADFTTIAQGQLFTKEQADELFGPVELGIAVETSTILNLLEKTSSKMMFGIHNNKAVVLDNQRNVLYSEDNYQPKSDAVFHVYSTIVIRELLEKGTNNITIIERREKVLSITNGNITMEVASICPPFCD